MTLLERQKRFLDLEETRLLKRAAEWHPERTLPQLSISALSGLSRVEGLDFATAVLHDRLLRTPAQAEFTARLESLDSDAGSQIDLIGIVPGAFYRQHKHTGADGKRILEIARLMGVPTELIPVKSFGALTQNARLIVKWLEARRCRRIVLVSLSKGSTDVKQALGLPDSQATFANVQAWVNFSGIVQGTPLVSWLKARPWRHFWVRWMLRLQGHSPATINELAWGEDAPLTSWPALPAGMRLVHVYGFPMRRHLCHQWATRAYERLESLGPNDGGGVLLGDMNQLPGIICPIWGADHYMIPAWDALPLLRDIVLASLQPAKLPQASLSAPNPSRQPAIKSRV
ncbi:MAG: hypothetical protein JWQ71_3400 [Pedosphaera sp.]|nr:hypothetical protein [Pedosphaera sp.]